MPSDSSGAVRSRLPPNRERGTLLPFRVRPATDVTGYGIPTAALTRCTQAQLDIIQYPFLPDWRSDYGSQDRHARVVYSQAWPVEEQCGWSICRLGWWKSNAYHTCISKARQQLDSRLASHFASMQHWSWGEGLTPCLPTLATDSICAVLSK